MFVYIIFSTTLISTSTPVGGGVRKVIYVPAWVVPDALDTLYVDVDWYTPSIYTSVWDMLSIFVVLLVLIVIVYEDTHSDRA